MRTKLGSVVGVAILLAAINRAAAQDIEESKTRQTPPISVAIQRPEKPVAAGERFAFKIKICNRSDGFVNLPKPKTINSFFRTWSRNPDGSELIVKHSGPSLGHGFYHGGYALGQN